MLTAVLESLRLADPAEAALFDRWPEAAGAELAALCRPERLEDGRLHVAAAHPAQAWEIGMRRDALLANVNAFLAGPGRAAGAAPARVTEVAVKTRRPHGA